MSSPFEISRIHKNTVTLTYDEFIRETLTSLGASQQAVDKWIPPPQSGIIPNAIIGVANAAHKDSLHLGERLCQQQLLPGKELSNLQSSLMTVLHDSLVWDRIPDTLTLPYTDKTKTVSLLGWCSDVLLESATRAFFGNRLLEIEPHLFENFYAFDASSWKIHYGYPRILSRDLHTARAKIHSALTTYFKLPLEERPGAAWLIQSFETKMKNLSIDETDIAAILIPVYWVINANAYKACFWMLAYILHHPHLLPTLLAEIDPVCSDKAPGLEYRLEACPRLKAIYFETLRLVSSTSTIRSVQDTTAVGEQVFRGGTEILIPYRQLHLDESVFGPSVASFDPDRFHMNKELSRSPCFRPFGAGSTLCPGRYLAQREILSFVALALHRFEIGVATMMGGLGRGGRVPGERFPRIDKKKLCLGILEPVRGDDVVLTVRERVR